MRKVDKLGRIVIPRRLREKYGLTEGVSLEFIDVGDGVTVKPATHLCSICHVEISEKSQFPLCDDCIAEIIKSHKK